MQKILGGQKGWPDNTDASVAADPPITLKAQTIEALLGNRIRIIDVEPFHLTGWFPPQSEPLGQDFQSDGALRTTRNLAGY